MTFAPQAGPRTRDRTRPSPLGGLVFAIAAVGLLAGTAPALSLVAQGALATRGPALLHEVAGLGTRARSLLGYLVLLGIAFALSSGRGSVSWRTVVWGVVLQFSFAGVVLRTGFGRRFFDAMNVGFTSLLGFTAQGTAFLLKPFGSEQAHPALMNFVFQVLPTIIFFASLTAVLYHLGVMQIVVGAMARVMQVTMGTSGAESLSAAANIFVGQTEAPLLVRPFVAKMTRSELMAIMVGGFATIAGGVMAAYVQILQPRFPEIAGHLMAASVMNAPAGLLLAKMMIPEREEPTTRGRSKIRVERPDPNVIGAAARGASEGMTLVLNVAAMLLAFIALIALLNALLGRAGGLLGFPGLKLETLLGNALRPVAWLLGVNWGDAVAVGNLMGEKIVLNEFVAYSHLGDTLAGAKTALTDRSVTIASYALLGFANFASIGIQIGGIGGLAPERRGDLARLGLRAMIAGTLAAYMSAAVAGLLVG